jgi:hypothetical protein
MIGNAVKNTEDKGAALKIEEAHVADAPEFPGSRSTGRNLISMSSQAFATLCRSRTVALLLGAEYETGSLPVEGRSVALLTEAHLTRVQTALRCSPDETPPGFLETLDASRARLLLLEWWMQWALAHCKTPAMATY